MGTTIHQLRAIVTSDIRGFLDGMGKVSTATASLRQQWMSTAAAINTAALRITGAIAGIGAYAAKSFAEFEDVMVEVGAITRTLGTKDFKLLENAAIKMGEETRYSATQAAEALKQLSLAGLGTEQSIAALPPTLQLAAAAGISIAQAATIAAKTMKAFGMEASQLAHVNDVLVSTFTRANTDLIQLSEGLKHVAPLAKVLNVSLEDTTAVLAKLADAGFQGEMGGTALRNILSRLAGAVPRAVGQLSRLGITTMDSTGKMRPMLDVLQDIQDKGLSAGQIMEVFGQRGGPQLLALLEVGIGAVKDFAKETEKAAGVAEQMQVARMKSLKGQWDELTSVIDSTFIKLGAEIAPILNQLINDTERWIGANQINIVLMFRGALIQMIDALRELLQWISANRQQLGGMAQALMDAVKWVAELVAQYPSLLMFFGVFQAARLLGVNDALFKMVGLIGSLIIELGKATIKWVAYTAAVKAASAASGAMPTVLPSTGAPAGLQGPTLSGAALGGSGMALAIAKAGALAVILAELGVVAWQLDQIFHAVERAAAKGAKALEEMAERGKKTVADGHDQQIQNIRNSRVEKTKADGVDPGAGFVVDQLQDRFKDEAQNLKERRKRQQEIYQQQLAAQAERAAARTPEEVTRAEAKVDQANSARMNIDNLIGNTQSLIGKLGNAIIEETANVFGQVRDQVKNKELRQSFSAQFEGLKAQFHAGAITVEDFRKGVDKLTEDLKAANADMSAGTRPFQNLAKTKRAAQSDAGSTVDFKQFDSTLGAINQLNNVDKLWAEEIVARTESEIAVVEEMRRTQGNTAAVLAAEAELNQKLKAIEAEAREATSLTLADKLSKTQKEQSLQRRKDASSGYEPFEAQLNEMLDSAGGIASGGLKNINTDAVRQLAKGLGPAFTEGDATGGNKIPVLTKELEGQFVRAFEDLKAKGPQAFAEGIEELTLRFVEEADKLKKNAEELQQALSDMEDPDGMDNRVEELRKLDLNPSNPAYAQYERLKEQARANQIDAGEFGRRTDRISTSLEAGQSAREGVADQRDGVVDQATEQAKEFSKKYGQKFVDGITSKMDEAVTKFNENLEKLQKEFLESDMSVDEFNRRLDQLKNGMDKVGQAALDAALKAQREAIMKGDFSSLDPQKALQERLFNFQMNRWNQYIDAIFNQMMGLGNGLNQFGQGLNNAMGGLSQFGNGINNMGLWIEHNLGGGGGGGGGFGGMPDISGGMKVWNSVQGKIATLFNDIASLEQILRLPNVKQSRKEEVKKQIEEIRKQIDFLSNPPPPMFIGTSGDPFFKDPGLISGGTPGNGQGQQQQSQSRSLTVNNNFPNVNRLNTSDVQMLFDRIEEEARRRGKRI